MRTSLRTLAILAALGLPALAQAGSCPAVEVLTDPAGDYDGDPLPPLPAGLPEQDLLGLSVASSGEGDEALLTFTLKTSGFTAPMPPPGAAWFASFENPEGSLYGVRMEADAMGAVTYFSYKVAPANGGQTDGRFTDAVKPAVSGEFDADGTITIVVKASSVGIAPDTGSALGPFNGAAIQSVPSLAAAVVDSMPAGLGRDGYFDTATCGKSASIGGKSSPTLLAGALPAGSLLVLALGGLAARRRRVR